VNPQQTTQTNTSRIYPWFVVLTLSGAMAFSLVDRFALSLLFEPIKADLGLSDTQLGLLHGVAFGLFYATMGIPIAWLIDRWSRKWVIFWGIATWSVMTALCGLCRSFPQLLGARVGVGVGEASLAPAGYSIITDIVANRYRATAISIFQMGSLMGGGLAFLAGGEILGLAESADLRDWPILEAMAPWQITFILVALPGVLFLGLVLLIKEPTRLAPSISEATTSGRTPPASKLGQELRTRWAMYGSLFIGNGCLIAINYGNMTWLPSILVRQYHWTLTDIGLRFGLVMLTVAPAGVLLGGILADRWNNRGISSAYPRVLLLAATCATTLVFVSLLANSAITLFAAIGAIQFATSMAVGAGPAAVVNIAPHLIRARISAVYVFMINIIGLGIGPIAVGLLSDHWFAGNDSVLLSLQLFSVVMGLLAIGSLLNLTRTQARAISP